MCEGVTRREWLRIGGLSALGLGFPPTPTGDASAPWSKTPFSSPVYGAVSGKLAYFEAFGMRDKARNVPMPRDAIFRLASMTKPITIAAAMMLVEEGRLSLADPISKYLPQFAHMQVGIEVGHFAAFPRQRPQRVVVDRAAKAGDAA